VSSGAGRGGHALALAVIAAGTVAVAVAAWTGAAAGQSATTVVPVGLAGTAAAPLVLTARGDVLARNGSAPAWRRVNRGAVGAELRAARGDDAGIPWAVGDAPPAYRFDGTTWNAAPVRRKGQTVLAASGAVAMAAGSRVWVWTGTAWKELPRVKGGAPVALWAAGPSDAAVVLDSGVILRSTGGAWKPVPKVDDARAIFGAGGDVVVVRDQGLGLLAGGAWKPLGIPSDLDGFIPQAGAAAGPGGRLRLVGRDSSGAVVVARVHKGKLERVDSATTSGDDTAVVGVLAGTQGELVVVTRGGRLLERAAAGGWTISRLEPEAVTESPRPANPPAQVGGTSVVGVRRD
jgi:hypothetical protein